jgi:hypothetical protein
MAQQGAVAHQPSPTGTTKKIALSAVCRADMGLVQVLILLLLLLLCLMVYLCTGRWEVVCRKIRHFLTWNILQPTQRL